MRLTFRQGLARYQTDVYATPTYLQKSSQSGEFINLVVSPDPTIIVFAHRGASYVIEESKTVLHAWGPFPTGQIATTKWLYWDVDLLDASLSRGYTVIQPEVAPVAPANPRDDQHWFDTTEKQMKVWNGRKWIEKIRVFAGVYSSLAIIQPMPLGSQAGQTGDFNAGDLVLDSYNKPVRQFDGTFLTTVSKLSVINSGTKQFKLEGEVISGMADEPIAKFSFIQIKPNRRIILARSDDWKSRIAGIVTEDLYKSEIGIVTTSGLVRNERWSFPKIAVGRPIFCGVTGEVTLTPPNIGVNQIAGYVFDSDSIYLNIQQVTILDDVRQIPAQPAPTPPPPIANFTATPAIGTLPLSVKFVSTSLHNPTSYEWDIGNTGTVDYITREFTHIFPTAGQYAVRLKVSNTIGVDEIVKSNAIIVNSPTFNPNIKKNLGIQLSGPLQVSSGQIFPVKIIVNNDGRLAAVLVERIIIINNMGNIPVTVTGTPTGTITQIIGNTLRIILPIIPIVNSGQFIQANFSIVTPAATGVIHMRANVVSPGPDSEPEDNMTELSIKVR